MPYTQPTGMKNDNGVIITVGVLTGGENTAMVMPVATDTIMTPTNLAVGALTDFLTAIQGPICDCMSSDAYIRFVAVEPMVDGKIPVRQDFGSSVYPGTRSSNTAPPQVAGLMVFYEDPDDVAAGKKMSVAKTFMPGISTADIVEGGLIGALSTAMQNLATLLGQGWANAAGGKWYRVLQVPSVVNPAPPPAPHKIRPPNQPILRTAQALSRGYSATQRRRLLPH